MRIAIRFGGRAEVREEGREANTRWHVPGIFISGTECFDLRSYVSFDLGWPVIGVERSVSLKW